MEEKPFSACTTTAPETSDVVTPPASDGTNGPNASSSPSSDNTGDSNTTTYSSSDSKEKLSGVLTTPKQDSVHREGDRSTLKNENEHATIEDMCLLGYGIARILQPPTETWWAVINEPSSLPTVAVFSLEAIFESMKSKSYISFPPVPQPDNETPLLNILKVKEVSRECSYAYLYFHCSLIRTSICS